MKLNIRISKIYIIRVLVIVILISSLLIMAKIEPGFLIHSNGAKMLDMWFGYKADDVLKLFENLGTEGRLIYVKYLYDDFVFTVSYALVQNYILKFVMGKVMLNSKWRILLVIAWVRASFDVAENIIILILLNSFPAISWFLASVVGDVTRLKFIAYGMWVFAIPVSISVRLIIREKVKAEVL